MSVEHIFFLYRNILQFFCGEKEKKNTLLSIPILKEENVKLQSLKK